MSDIRTRLEKCLNNIGVFVQEDEENVLLADLIDDSLMFVTMIIEIEQEFGIEVPDEYLLPERLQSLHDLETLVEELMES